LIYDLQSAIYDQTGLVWVPRGMIGRSGMADSIEIVHVIINCISKNVNRKFKCVKLQI